MIAYYIHWRYPASADDANFYAGRDDNKLFHHEENAIKYAKEQLIEYERTSSRFNQLNKILSERELTSDEADEWTKCAVIGDFPYDYSVCKREIKFEDED